jgi:hypothetical protein
MKTQSWSQLFRAPFQAASAPNKPPTLDDIPDLIDQIMLHSNSETRAAAAKRIYELCDVAHKENRVPMVCSAKYDVLTPLAKCLTQDSGKGRHLACLALNNLSVPPENRHAMALGPASKDVIGALCRVIAEDKHESYICCICLMNLSFLEASITSILQYSPPLDDKALSPLDNPNSLLRVLEKLLANAPDVPKSESGKSETDKLLAAAVPKASSSKSEAVRWTCGSLKNLAKSEENAALIGKTNIPKYVVENIRAATDPPSQWKSNSLEDYALSLILHLAQWPVCHETLIRVGAEDAIKPVASMNDPRGIEAKTVCALLEAKKDALAMIFC